MDAGVRDFKPAAQHLVKAHRDADPRQQGGFPGEKSKASERAGNSQRPKAASGRTGFPCPQTPKSTHLPQDVAD